MSASHGRPRIGCVPYLNALPLRHGIEATLATPAVLAAEFEAGHFDAALLPLFEILQRDPGIVADGFGICADGPVRSVFVAHRHPLDTPQEIVLDPASRTSSNLLRVLVARVFHPAIRCVRESSDPDAARLLIGDPALAFRREAHPDWLFTDLAMVWKEWTGLPFVFALWAFPDETPASSGLAERLREAARSGLAVREELVRDQPDPAAALDYLTLAIRHEIPAGGKAAIARYRAELSSLGLLPENAGGLRWI